MTDQDAPKIEFPCDYPIKVIGTAGVGLRERVVEIMRIHAGDIDETIITERVSSEGRFQSLTVTIIATGEPQLKDIFADLKATGIVKMVL
ncbi:MAG: putative lipoic acid-binding regulatory protein [Zhongshania sp.]|jgi:putative lipoic acid-binding regulatory protein